MRAVALAPFEEMDQAEILRWGLAGAAIFAAHVALIGGYLLLHRPDPWTAGAPVVLVELTTLPNEPDAAPLDVPQPEVIPPSVEPEVVKPADEPPPPPTKTEVILPQPTKPKPLPRPKAPPARAAAPAARIGITSVDARAAEASWRDLLVAHLQWNKRYPNGAQARREQGMVVLSFSMDRNGHVLARHIARSSGVPELDEEVLAMIQRAQPLPAFPPSMAQSRMDLTVPIRFALH
jgi:protein TonB